MTRHEILEAAAQIFSQKGYHATSMADIAEAVHLQKASLYHHVSSKQEILAALLDQALDVLIERIGAVVNQPLPPDQKLRCAIATYLEAVAEHRDLASILLLEYRSLETPFRERHIPRRDRFEALWRGLVQEGKRSGVFNCADPVFAARALLGVMNWTITWYRPDGELTPQEIADRYANLLLNGLLVRESTH
jgi:AcrR family transcriptional regulator